MGFTKAFDSDLTDYSKDYEDRDMKYVMDRKNKVIHLMWERLNKIIKSMPAWDAEYGWDAEDTMPNVSLSPEKRMELGLKAAVDKYLKDGEPLKFNEEYEKQWCVLSAMVYAIDKLADGEIEVKGDDGTDYTSWVELMYNDIVRAPFDFRDKGGNTVQDEFESDIQFTLENPDECSDAFIEASKWMTEYPDKCNESLSDAFGEDLTDYSKGFEKNDDKIALKQCIENHFNSSWTVEGTIEKGPVYGICIDQLNHRICIIREPHAADSAKRVVTTCMEDLGRWPEGMYAVEMPNDMIYIDCASYLKDIIGRIDNDPEFDIKKYKKESELVDPSSGNYWDPIHHCYMKQ